MAERAESKAWIAANIHLSKYGHYTSRDLRGLQRTYEHKRWPWPEEAVAIRIIRGLLSPSMRLRDLDHEQIEAAFKTGMADGT